VEILLRKYLWALDGVVVAICAIFLARAASTGIATALEKKLVGTGPAPKVALRAPTPATPATVYSKQVEEILKRNIFCSACPPILAVEGTGPGPIAPPPLQRTALNLKLLAIMFAPPPADPRWSVAVIRDNDAKTAGPYNVGSKIRDATIEDIDDAKVYLDFGGGRHEYLDLLDRPQPAAGAPVAAATPTDPFQAELDKGIKQISDHKYEVQRSTLDALTNNMAALARAARIVPEVRDGKSVGFRLFSIRPDGPFAKIGLQNNDVVSAINGLEMTSPDQALLAYTKLKTANHLTVAVERNGQKITKDYNIR
jgi:general secretion pathway protein C